MLSRVFRIRNTLLPIKIIFYVIMRSFTFIKKNMIYLTKSVLVISVIVLIISITESIKRQAKMCL